MENSPSPSFRRRSFLATLLGFIGAALAALTTWPLWRYLSPAERVGEEEAIRIPLTEVQVGDAHYFNFRGHPAVAVQVAQGRFNAFSAVCTHLGCIVQWIPEKDEFLCPCHAGRFSADGAVLSGPPPRPLETLPVTVADDYILVG